MPRKTSLLERALGVKRRKTIAIAPTQEELELLVAFFNDEVTTSQVANALGAKHHTNALFWATSTLRRAIAHNLLEVVWKERRI